MSFLPLERSARKQHNRDLGITNLIQKGTMRMKSPVRKRKAADREAALAHFEARLSFETDCWDVDYSIRNDLIDFVLLDVRSPELFETGHVPTAINLPTNAIDTKTLPPLMPDTIYVVYCAGPHCNGANKAAIRIAQLGYPVKEMIGGAIGWLDEGFELVTA